MPDDRRAAGPATGDGTRLAAAIRLAGGGGAGVLHRAAGRRGRRSGDARAGRVAGRRCGGGGGRGGCRGRFPVAAPGRGAGVGGRVGGEQRHAAGPALAVIAGQHQLTLPARRAGRAASDGHMSGCQREVPEPMSKAEEEQKTRRERAQAIALFRYMLIREAADAGLSARQRGAMVRQIAARPHVDPFGRRVRISRWTLDRWIAAWHSGGFDALVPSPRQSQPRTPGEVMQLAAALKKENPARSAAQVRRILRAELGWAPDERTLQRMFTRAGLTSLAAPEQAPQLFGRFEASRPNELWTGDALHGIRLGSRKTYLFAFLDDHSRAIMAARFGFSEDTVRLAAALRPALAARGVPEYVYVDNGSAFVDAWLLRACAKLGIKLVHSAPGRPQGRGKIERFFRDVNSEFVVEIAAADGAPGRVVRDLAELNRLFTAWVETVYHRRVHSETGLAPLPRWLEGGPYPVPAPADLAEAF